MNIERLIRIFAGSFVIISLALAHFGGQIDLSRPSWLWFTAFVGANLIQSSHGRTLISIREDEVASQAMGPRRPPASSR